MESAILEALPAIHTSIIGVGAGFFSGYLVYAYDRLRETGEKLHQAIGDVISASEPSTWFDELSSAYFKGDQLDWDDKGKEVVDRAFMHYGHADIEARHGITMLARREPSAEEASLDCWNLCRVLQTMFTTYPFLDRRYDGGTTGPDDHRIQEMERRIGFLSWQLSNHPNSLWRLAEVAAGTWPREGSQIKKMPELLTIDDAPNYPEMLSRWRSQLFLHTHAINFNSVLSEYFRRVISLENLLLPQLKSAIVAHRSRAQRFQLMKRSRVGIGLAVFILLTGVVLPPVLQSAGLGLCSRQQAGVEYVLLTVTMAPYFFGCWWLYRLVSRLTYK